MKGGGQIRSEPSSPVNRRLRVEPRGGEGAPRRSESRADAGRGDDDEPRGGLGCGGHAMTSGPGTSKESPPPVGSALLGPPRLRLEYLDGVRAVAAIYVSFYHALMASTWTGIYHRLPPDLPLAVNQATRFLRFGHFAVGVFIVLSGYCLMLPVARARDGRLPGGEANFLWRRGRRILPPYYAALLFCLLLTMLPGMNRPAGTRFDEVLPAWSFEAICSHILLIQNWNHAWFFKIDAPAWSVAVEWQIYWLFAVVLLPLARWLGSAAAAVLALAFGAAVHLIFAGRYDFVGGAFVGLFALGMLGASIGFSDAAWTQFVRRRVPWGSCALFGWTLFAGVALSRGAEWMEDHSWLTDPLAGAATFCLLVVCTRASFVTAPAASPFLLRIFRDKRLVRFGAFSYSYYLVHDPILNLLHIVLQPLGLSYAAALCWMFTLGIALCVSTAYLFHLLFERPFMPGSPKSVRQAARTAVLSPAP